MIIDSYAGLLFWIAFVFVISFVFGFGVAAIIDAYCHMRNKSKEESVRIDEL